MALATITFDASDYADVDFDPRRTKVYSTNNVAGGVVVDTVGNRIYLGSGNGTINADGTGEIKVPEVGDPGYNPDSWQTTIHFDYPDRNTRGGRKVKSFGPFTITASANLADLIDEQEVPPTYLTTITELLDGYASSASASAVTAAAAATSAAASAEAANGGSGGGSSALTIVSGGSIDLDNTKPNGYLIGYRVTSTTTIEGASFAAGSYIFERNSGVTSGWTYRTLAASTDLTTVPDVTAPTAPSLSVNNAAATQLVATFSGGTDAIGVTQYRSRIGGGSWTVGASPRTFTGLTGSTSYTIDVQAGDAAGNWSPTTTWTGSTAAPGADSIPPTSGALAGSAISASGFTLTVSGAGDETGLAASPYAFSTDNGSTWTAYQSSAVYVATGKAASTGYQCRHRVKDATGNVTTGSAITVTTSAPVALVDITDNFNAANASTLSGRSTVAGGKTWISPYTTGLGDNNLNIVSNKVELVGVAGGAAAVSTDGQNYRVTGTYTTNTGLGASQARLYARSNSDSSIATPTSSVNVSIKSDGTVAIDFGSNLNAIIVATGQPSSGVLALEVNGITGKVLINGSQVGSSFTISNSITGPYAAFALFTEATMDDFKVEYL